MALSPFYSGTKSVSGTTPDTVYYLDRPAGAVREITDPNALGIDITKLPSLSGVNFQQESLSGSGAVSSQQFLEQLVREGLNLKGKSFDEINAALNDPAYLAKYQGNQPNIAIPTPTPSPTSTTSPVISSQGAQISLDKTTQDFEKFLQDAQSQYDQGKIDYAELQKAEKAFYDNLEKQTIDTTTSQAEADITERQKLGSQARQTYEAQAARSGATFAGSTGLDLNKIELETQQAVQELRRKRDASIADAKLAIQEKRVGAAKDAYAEARTLQKELLDRQVQGATMKSNALTQARADQTAAQTEANRVRDDARTVITSALTTFGGAGIENMAPETRAFLEKKAEEAGFGPGYIEGSFRTLKEQATAQQQALAEAKLKDKQQQDLFMNSIRTSQLAISALHASIAAAKADGTLQLGTLSGKFSENYLKSRAGEYLNSDGSVDWLGLDALENTDKNLWHDMTVVLEAAQTAQAKAIEEMGTAPEDTKNLTDQFKNKTALEIVGSGTELFDTAITKGMNWLFGDTNK